MLERPLQSEERGTDLKKTVIRENAKNQENKSRNVKELTPQEERLACRYLDRWASNHPASRPRAPREQAQALTQ